MLTRVYFVWGLWYGRVTEVTDEVVSGDGCVIEDYGGSVCYLQRILRPLMRYETKVEGFRKYSFCRKIPA